jgi:ureidoacrylate peracid hydrolase
MTSALIVIDPQNIYTVRGEDLFCRDSKKTIERINQLIDRFRSLEEPIVFVRHVHKADGSDLGRMFDYAGDDDAEFNFIEGTSSVEYSPALKIPKEGRHFVKNRYSAFSSQAFVRHLAELRVSRLVVCGFMTNFCCESTARDGHDRDFYVDFVLDATGSPGTDKFSEKQVREVVGELLGAGFCTVYSTKQYLKKK